MSVRAPWKKVRNYYQRNAAALLFRRSLLIKPARPLISFTFDDFPRSAWLTAGAILGRFGVLGTYYVSFGLLGKEAPAGQMFVESDVKDLVKEGHELGCHTFSHCHSWNTNPVAFETSMIENRRALRALLPSAEFKTFSFPLSPPRPAIKRRTANHFMCCRAGGQVPNVGKTDLNQLSAYFLEKTRNRLASVMDVIERNGALGGWLILATHDVSDNPSPYGCTPAFFEDVVRAAVASGAHVVPVHEALKVLGVSQRVSWERPVTGPGHKPAG